MAWFESLQALTRRVAPRPASAGLVALLLANAQALASPACELAGQELMARAEAQGLQLSVLQCQAPARPDMGQHWQQLAADEARPALRSGRLLWPLRQRLPDGRSQVQQLVVQLRVSSWAWVLRHDKARDELLQREDLQRVWLQWPAGETPLVAAEEPTLGRLAQPRKAGQPIGAAQLRDATLLAALSPVQLRLQQDGVELQMEARLLQAAHVGEIVRVQPQGRAAVFSGRLVAPGRVEAELE